MALKLREFLPYRLVLWGGSTRHLRLDQQVLYARESVERVN